MSAPIALVTGASQRIGRALTEHLHGIGYRVVIHYHSNADKAEAFAEELNRQRPQSAITLQADLQNPQEIEALITAFRQKHERLDLLINNASMFEPDPSAGDILEHYQSLQDINTRAAFLLSRKFTRLLKLSHGNIINLVDIYADRPLQSHTAYSISKAGLAMLTRSLAVELAPQIRVNGIAPGAILWPHDPPSSEAQQQLLSKIPLGRLGSMEAIVHTLHFLIHCDYVSGQIIPVDGGRSITI